MDKKQIKRIEKMEANLDEARFAVDKLAEALSGYEEIQDKAYCFLVDYISVPFWQSCTLWDGVGLFGCVI